MVWIGEATHGDGEALVAGSRVIRFLHEELGFDVFGWESDFYGCEQADRGLIEGGPGRAALLGCAFGFWSRSDQLGPLSIWMEEQAKSDRPLHLAGIDPQLHQDSTRDHLVPALEGWLQKTGSQVIGSEDWPGVRALLADLAARKFQNYVASKARGWTPKRVRRLFLKVRPDAPDRERFYAALAALEAESGSWQGDDAAWWGHVLENLDSRARTVWADDVSATLGPNRDIQMGRNLLWLARDPNARVVVWGATFHGVRATELVDSTDSRPDGLTVAGQVVHDTLGAAYYSLAVTAAGGHAGRVPDGWNRELSPPSPGSVEDLVVRAGLDAAIVDLRAGGEGAEWLEGELTARPMGYVEETGPWSRVVDGLLVLGEMKPLSYSQ